MIKNLKKAFTIIELVIVIAVIAVLAAVMIPTYSSLVEKANQSADIQAVQQINTILIAEESSSKKFESLNEVIPVLNESGIKLDSYTALSNDHKIIWDKKLNRVLYVNNTTNEVVYPEQYKKNSFDDDYRLENWVGLDGKMTGDPSWKTTKVELTSQTSYTINNVDIKLDSGVTYEKYIIKSAAQLIDLAETLNKEVASSNDTNTNVSEYEIKSNWIIELENKEYDMLGAEWEPIMNFDGIFNGNGATIKNIRMTSEKLKAKQYNSWTKNPYYAYGFLSTFTGKYFGNVTLDVDYNCPGAYASSTNHTVAGAIGAVYANENEIVYVDNVTVTGSIINERRAGGIIGFVGGTEQKVMNGIVVIQNCKNEAKVESTYCKNSYSTAAGIVSTSNQVSNSGIVEIRGCINNGEITGHCTAGILANSFIKNAQPKYYIYSNTNNGKISSKYIAGRTSLNGDDTDDASPLEASIYTNFNGSSSREYLYCFQNQFTEDNLNIACCKDDGIKYSAPNPFNPTGNYPNNN